MTSTRLTTQAFVDLRSGSGLHDVIESLTWFDYLYGLVTIVHMARLVGWHRLEKVAYVEQHGGTRQDLINAIANHLDSEEQVRVIWVRPGSVEVNLQGVAESLEIMRDTFDPAERRRRREHVRHQEADDQEAERHTRQSNLEDELHRQRMNRIEEERGVLALLRDRLEIEQMIAAADPEGRDAMHAALDGMMRRYAEAATPLDGVQPLQIGPPTDRS